MKPSDVLFASGIIYCWGILEGVLALEKTDASLTHFVESFCVEQF